MALTQIVFFLKQNCQYIPCEDVFYKEFCSEIDSKEFSDFVEGVDWIDVDEDEQNELEESVNFASV